MLTRQFPLYATLVFILLLVVESCKDMGSSVPPPGPGPLALGQSSLSIASGDSAVTTVAGGIPPYTIVSQSDTAVVVASIVEESLRLFARSVGASTIVVGDDGNPAFHATLTVTVTELILGRTTFNLISGDSATTTISGGIPPYSVVSNSDPSTSLVAITGTSLEIHALAAGSSTIRVGDGSSPQFSAAIIVNVSAAVSFSGQVQPVFTAGCVNAGCHPGGGAPFPLAAGVSYASLVNVRATNGPCAGDLRVQPSNADASALIKRLEGTCGVQMPLGGSPLPSAKIQLIRNWINQGARNN